MYKIHSSFSNGVTVVTGREAVLIDAMLLSTETRQTAGLGGLWIKDEIFFQEILITTCDIAANGNWKLGSLYLDVFLGAVLEDGKWQSYWLQPDGVVIVLTEYPFPFDHRPVDVIPDFYTMPSEISRVHMCDTCGRAPAQGIGHDHEHAGIMAPYAIFECGNCAWDSPIGTYYADGQKNVQLLKRLAAEFYW